MAWTKFAVAIALGTAGLTTSSLVSAQAEPRGFYLGASIGQMEADGDCPSGSSCDFKDTAFKLFGGYRINRNFAAELFWGEWGDITINRGAVSARGEIRSIGIAGLGILPVGRNFELFGKLGIANSEQQASASGAGVTLTDRDSGADVLLGLGAAYNFTPNLAVRAEWERLNDSEVNIVSIGLQYRF